MGSHLYSEGHQHGIFCLGHCGRARCDPAVAPAQVTILVGILIFHAHPHKEPFYLIYCQVVYFVSSEPFLSTYINSLCMYDIGETTPRRQSQAEHMLD